MLTNRVTRLEVSQGH